MFGLTFDKLLIIALLIGMLFGPEALPRLATWCATTLRAVRDWIAAAQQQARREYGPDIATWTEHDPRQYDPRRIIRDALTSHDDSQSIDEPTPTREPVPDPQPPRRRRRSDGHWESLPT